MEEEFKFQKTGVSTVFMNGDGIIMSQDFNEYITYEHKFVKNLDR